MARLTASLWLFVWFISLPALAAEPALHWVRARGAERCIEPAALAERVEGLTGTAFVAPAAAELTLEGLVEPAGKGFRVRLVSSRRGGARSVERVLSTKSRDCRLLDAAVAFVIALTIDPGLSLAGVPAEVLATFSQELSPEQALLAEIQSEAPAAPRASAAPAPAPAPAAVPPLPPTVRGPHGPPPLRYGFGLAAAALSGSSPGWLGGMRGSFGLAFPRRVVLALTLGAFPSLRAQPVSSEHSATFQSYDATLSACPGLHWGDFHALGCAGIALSYLHARGRDFERDHSEALWDPAATFALSAGVGLARGFGLFASATLRVRFLASEFELASGSGSQTAFRPPRVAGLFSLGPSYEF